MAFTTLKNKPSLLIIAAFFLLSCLVENPTSSSSSLDSELSAIKDICKSRLYPELCFDSLKLSISIGISPGVLDSLLRTLQDALSEAGKLSDILSVGESDMVIKLKGTMQDCTELHDITVSLLQRCIFDSEHDQNPVKLADYITYLNAALTNKETCLEGLESASGPSKQAILSSMDSTYEHVSNALSMLSQESGKSLEKTPRRLTGYPSWIPRKDRRILENSDYEYDGAPILTVAADGSANFTTITDAVNFAPNHSNHRIIIRVKKGTYQENVFIPKAKPNIVLIGDGSDSTIITGSRSKGDLWTTYRSATLGVDGEGFLARDITVENSAGPAKNQSVALLVNSDVTALYRCSIKGYQDTLYVHANRQFYRECDIYGTIDYIFGNAQAVIQASKIISLMPGHGRDTVTITAQSSTNGSGATGISIQNCSILPTEDLKSAAGRVKSYLGRPWRKFARTVIMYSYIDSFIAPEGWIPWSENDKDGLSTVYYGEYKNNGPGSNTDGRVSSKGFHVMNHDEASKFTVSEFIIGDQWLGPTRIPYDKGI